VRAEPELRAHEAMTNQVRITTASRNGTCPACRRRIIARRSRVALVFASKQWVHVQCLDEVPRT
jgi:RNase P subunit RPR2